MSQPLKSPPASPSPISPPPPPKERKKVVIRPRKITIRRR